MDTAGRPFANFWQGLFPTFNSDQDGFEDRAPVGCFAANQVGVYDTVDNVWEWTNDGYTGTHQPYGNGVPNKICIRYRLSYKSQQEAVIKVGSHLCSADFCAHLHTSARQAQEVDLPASRVDFRTVRSN